MRRRRSEQKNSPEFVFFRDLIQFWCKKEDQNKKN